MTNRLAICLSVAVVATVWPLNSQTPRHIPFAGSRSIFDVLRPDDRIVILDDNRTIEFMQRLPPTEDEELGEISTAPYVVVFKVLESSSFLIKSNTWIGTRVVGQIEHSFNFGDSEVPFGRKPGELVLEFDSGELEINGVVVKAGRYPYFPIGSRYLALLAYEGATRSWRIGRGFRIDAENKLARLNNWNGTIDWFSGPLEGVALEKVLAQLKKQ